MTDDAFGTAALRAAVLQAWTLSPARLREDANSEEDHARGYYRDRVVVELAQNAADAATRAGVPGRLLLRLGEADGRTVLVAANTGAPLDAEGIASLASLRASAKRDGRGATSPVGRFGVGFAAVRSVSDEIAVGSTTGAVRFSLAATAGELASLGETHPTLAAEVRRREGSLPALRLPWPGDERPPSGYDTAVVLELRDGAASAEVRALLAGIGDPLLLALPGLAEIVVEIDVAGDSSLRRIADVGSRWTIARGAGTLDLALLADRPVEERRARGWRVTWALPRSPAGSAPSPDRLLASAFSGAIALPCADAVRGSSWGSVVHAPTPTEERSALPALLVATLPLDPSRRHVARGALTDAVLDHAAEVYADLARTVAAAGGDPLALVPAGLPGGPLDAALSERIIATLSATPLLTSPLGAADADAGADLLEPRRSVALASGIGRDRQAVGELSHWAANLVVLGPGQEAPARVLGVEVRELADLVEELPTVAAPERWLALYAALAR